MPDTTSPSMRPGRITIVSLLIAALTVGVVFVVSLKPDTGGDAKVRTVQSLEALDPGAEGIELPTARTAEPCRAVLRIIVRSDQRILVRGLVGEWEGWIEELEDALRSGGFSAGACPVLISADRRIRWPFVQWVIRACFDAGIEREKFALEVDSGEALTALLISTPRPWLFDEKPGEGKLFIELRRRRHESATRVAMFEAEIGTGEQGLSLLSDELKGAFGEDSDLPVEINIWAWVPSGEVVRVLDTIRRCGFTEFSLRGLPPIPMYSAIPR